MRFMALWFPDWPVHAARLALEIPAKKPVAILRQHHVWACDVTARRAGVRRGMRGREAQALSPELLLQEHDVERDARRFEPVVQGLDAVVASVEVLRPGLAVVDAGAAARFHGGEERAAQLLIDAAALHGVDCLVGVADNIETAVLAARSGQVVAPGENQAFLQDLPTRILLAEEALGCDSDAVAALQELGLQTLGQIAQLPEAGVVTRFGADGQHIMRLVRGEQLRKVAPAWTGPDLAVSAEPEAPLNRVDAAAFFARGLAVRLHETLRQASVVCHRLRVSAEINQSGQEYAVQRVWRTREPLTEAATADRVRWQLDGWLTARGVEESADEGGIVRLVLEPLEVSAPEREALWGGAQARDAQARKVASRVQSTLGIDAVLQPVSVGGRGPLEQVEFVAFGEEARASKSGSWAGRVPGPLPTRARHPAATFTLIDAHGQNVYVTAEAVLSSHPYACSWGSFRERVTGWAGPWPVDERWWDADNAVVCARLQVVAQAEQPRAFLLVWLGGRWKVEATYD